MDTPTITDVTSTALIQKDVAYMRSDMTEIKQSIKELAGVYATKIYVDDLNKGIQERLIRLEASSNLWRWLSPTMSAALSAIMTFLIINYISRSPVPGM